MSGKRAAEASLSWAQVHAFRVERHHLERRAPKRALAKVAGAIGGAQAQVMSAAEMQLAVRADCSAADVRRALWDERTFVKTWLMRGTLHLVPAEDLPLYTAALRAKWIRPRPAWLKFFHLTERELDRLVEEIGAVLSDRPMTREEIIAVAGGGRSRVVREWLRSGWGGFLKPVARRGLLCFGPSRGQSVTFVRPEAWLGAWRDVDPEAALVEVARRYLRTYGPATKSDFARWFGPSWPGPREAAWSGLARELVPVSVDGVRADALASDMKALLRTERRPSVALLPSFDPYLMGHRTRDHLFDRVHTRKVSRVAGWISAVVLVDGRVLGTWTHAAADGALRIAVVPFGPLPARVRSGVELRAASLAKAVGLERAEVRLIGRAR